MDQKAKSEEINGETDIKGNSRVYIVSSFPWLRFHRCIFMQIMMDGPRRDEWNWQIFMEPPQFSCSIWGWGVCFNNEEMINNVGNKFAG